MAKIAILDDEPEVVTLLAHFLTVQNRTVMKLVGETERVIEQAVAFQPDLILIPIYRPPELIGRPLTDFDRDVRGARILDMVRSAPLLRPVPVVVFSFSVRFDELPESFLQRVRIDAFLRFPEGLQELNPTLSGFLGPARGSLEDLDRLAAEIRSLKSTPPDE